MAHRYLVGLACAAALAACGGEGPEPDVEDLVAAVGAAADPACGVFDKLIAARAETPAFSSVDPADDMVPGATSCRVLDSVVHFDSWSLADGPKTTDMRTYECTLAQGLDRPSAEELWNETMIRWNGQCFTDDWMLGMGGGVMRDDDTQRLRWVAWSRDGLDFHEDVDGVRYQALGLIWRQNDGGADEVMFLVAED